MKSKINPKCQTLNFKIKKFLPKVKENISLKPYNTFKIGGSTKYFFEAKNKEDLISAIKVAKKLKLPFFVLGRGSNLLVADEGYDGLIIKVKSQKLKSKIKNQKSKIIECEAGISLNQIVAFAIKNNLTGLEWAIGIPGTIGGAVYGNAGSFGKSMADVVKEVEVLDVKDLKIKKLKNKDCEFGYRDSLFKKRKNLIILSVKLTLQKNKPKKIKQYLDYRKNTQPLNFPSAGSIFKNPPGFSAGELIEKCGLKGKKIGDAQISEKHANFIVNLGNAKARDVIKLIELTKKRVRKKFKIKLEEEIQYLGFKK